MRILIVNKYHKLTGGADRYALDLARLLLDNGHAVAFLAMEHPDNWPAHYPLYTISEGLTHQTWDRSNVSDQARAFIHGLYHREAAQSVHRAVAEFRPDLIHLQSIFYQLSPSVIHAAHQCRLPVVQTLHDFHPVCANSALFHHGHCCEECRPRRFHRILINRCYNGSLLASSLAFSAKVFHTITRLYPRGIQHFIAPSRFLKEKIESFGLSLAPIASIPNFLDTSKYVPCFEPGRYVLFFGQLLKHKGLDTLLEAAQHLQPGIPIIIAGTGPEEERLKQEIKQRQLHHVSLVGYQLHEALFSLIRQARLVVVPSECYENQPYSIVESFALGKPVIAAATGGIPELMDERVGVLFPPGDAQALAETINRLFFDVDHVRAMGIAARDRVIYTLAPHRHLDQLVELYEKTKADYRRQG